jgi:hypothetical protein
MTPTTSCPACGGPLHPIAGRCKHCRTDLVAMRDAWRQRARRVAPVGWPGVDGSAPAVAASPAAIPAAPSPLGAIHSAPPHHAERGFIARRWPLLVTLVALTAIAVSLGVLVGDDRPAAAATPLRGPGAAPGLLPDPMPSQVMPAPSPRPAPGPGPSAPRGASPSGPDATSPQAFAAALTATVCRKLGECGVVDASVQMMCELVATQLGDADPDAATGGQCRFDRAAADACLGAVGQLDCSAGGGADLAGWLVAANQLAECTRAYRCQ